MRKTGNLVRAGLFIGLGIVLPMLFHFTGISGKVLLPMHIPVLLGGFYIEKKYMILVGVLTPLLSSILTGMPPLYPMVPIMILELSTYGFAIAYLKEKGVNKYLNLILSMIVGRIMAGIAVFILTLMMGFKANPILFVKGSIITGLPGIIIQLILIPILISLIKE